MLTFLLITGSVQADFIPPVPARRPRGVGFIACGSGRGLAQLDAQVSGRV